MAPSDVLFDPLQPDPEDSELGFLQRTRDQMDPVLPLIRMPAAQHFMAQGGRLILEILLYLCSLALFASTWFLSKIYPFYLLEEFVTSREYLPLGRTTAEDLQLAQGLLILLLSFLFFILARMVRRARIRSRQLHQLAHQIKTLRSQLELRIKEIEDSAQPRSEEPTI